MIQLFLTTPFLWPVLAVVAFVVLIILLIVVGKRTREAGQRRAGKEGEKACMKLIQRIQRPSDILFSNVELSYDGKRTELDCLVVNPYGIFIIEAKNYSGRLIGKADDYEWDKYHTTDAGNTYVKKVKNPIKQVGRQTYILSHILQKHGIHGWIEGYAFLAQGSSPVRSKEILLNTRQMNRAIHPHRERILTDKDINRIRELFRIYEK